MAELVPDDHTVDGSVFFMAKMSKKIIASPSVEADKLNEYFREWIDDEGIFLQHEPIAHTPNVDMFSTNTELVIEVEMPGVRRDDIEITLYKNTLTIKALKFECFEEDKINYVCMERSFGKLLRAIDIPFPVDTVRVKASFRNGILKIIIPRVADKRSQTKKVPIESI